MGTIEAVGHRGVTYSRLMEITAGAYLLRIFGKFSFANRSAKRCALARARRATSLRSMNVSPLKTRSRTKRTVFSITGRYTGNYGEFRADRTVSLDALKQFAGILGNF